MSKWLVYDPHVLIQIVTPLIFVLFLYQRRDIDKYYTTFFHSVIFSVVKGSVLVRYLPFRTSNYVGSWKYSTDVEWTRTWKVLQEKLDTTKLFAYCVHSLFLSLDTNLPILQGNDSSQFFYYFHDFLKGFDSGRYRRGQLRGFTFRQVTQ